MTQQFFSILLALTTILMWGSLATLGNLLIHLPPFYILGICFILGSLPSWFRPKKMFPNLRIFAFGVAGMFGYHFFLFSSFRYAPAIEANLINYLWPVIMVILTPAFFREEKLKFYHLLGGILAILGSVVLVLGEGGTLKSEFIPGYLLALGAAILWPIYSIGKKKLPPTSVWSVGGFCLGTGILCFMAHFWLEPRVVLQGHDVWKLIVIGIGPCGLAFYTWDRALLIGDSRIIGALSYLTPVISTLGLIFFGGQSLEDHILIAMLLIISGASSGILDIVFTKR